MKKASIKKFSVNLFSVFIVIFILNTVLDPIKSANYVREALNLCYVVIIPSLLPFMIFSKILLNTPLINTLGKILNRPAKFLFNVPGMYAGAYIIGILAGFPTGAKNVAELYKSNPHTKNEAERMLGFCNCASPAFVVSAVGITLFKSVYAGIILYAIHIISSVITGIILRFISGSPHIAANAQSGKQEEVMPLSRNIAEAISDSVTGILQICGIVICFSMTANIIADLIRLLDVNSLINENRYNNIRFILSSIFEMSSGTDALGRIIVPGQVKFVLASAVISFSGLSVHMQIFNSLMETGLSLKNYFTGKTLNVIISLILSYLYTVANKNSGIFRYVGANPAFYQYNSIFIPNVSSSSFVNYLIVSMIITGIIIILLVALLLAVNIAEKYKRCGSRIS